MKSTILKKKTVEEKKKYHREYSKKWRKENPQKVRAYNIEHYQKSKKVLAYNIEHYQKSKGKLNKDIEEIILGNFDDRIEKFYNAREIEIDIVKRVLGGARNVNEL